MSLQTVFFLSLYASSAHADDKTIPTPKFVHSRTEKSDNFLTIEWIAGCHGNLDDAKGQVLAPKDILQEPEFLYSSYTKGVFNVPSPSCVIDDNPSGVQPLNMGTSDLEEYLFTEFNCGCGDCTISEDITFGEDEIMAHATEQHKKDYATYKIQRDKEVAEGKVIHEQYTADYSRWSKIRDEKLTNKAIRITVTPSQDMAEGTMTIYNFYWQMWSFCGVINSANRINIQSKEFSHPAVKKGEQLTVWLDNANTDISWGVVFHNQERASQEIINLIEEEADRRQLEGLDPEGVPETLKGVIMETGPGRAADLSDNCCAC